MAQMSERKPPLPPTRGLTAITGAMALIVVLVLVQVWLLSAALESYLAGQPDTALPAALASGFMFGISLFLYIFIDYVDAEARRRT
jgi:hypothetical protein